MSKPQQKVRLKEKKWLNYKMGSNTKENGKETIGMALELKFGLTRQNIWDIGRKIWSMVKELFIIKMGIPIKGIGSKTRPMATVCTLILKTAKSTKGISKTTFNMDKASKLLLMEAIMKVSSKRERDRVKGNTKVHREPLTLESGLKGKWTDMESVNGQTKVPMKDTGCKTGSMAEEFLPGQMAETLRVFTRMIKEMEREFKPMKKAWDIQVHGKKEELLENWN